MDMPHVGDKSEQVIWLRRGVMVRPGDEVQMRNVPYFTCLKFKNDNNNNNNVTHEKNKKTKGKFPKETVSEERDKEIVSEERDLPNEGVL